MTKAERLQRKVEELEQQHVLLADRHKAESDRFLRTHVALEHQLRDRQVVLEHQLRDRQKDETDALEAELHIRREELRPLCNHRLRLPGTSLCFFCHAHLDQDKTAELQSAIVPVVEEEQPVLATVGSLRQALRAPVAHAATSFAHASDELPAFAHEVVSLLRAARRYVEAKTPTETDRAEKKEKE